ncbi:MAG: diacylglycerol kinase, partial [Gillisia sp.]
MNIKNKMLFVVNPISGNFDKSQLQKLVKKKCEEKKLDFFTYETTGEDDSERISEIIKKEKPE